jgi:hypothetical protein
LKFLISPDPSEERIRGNQTIKMKPIAKYILLGVFLPALYAGDMPRNVLSNQGIVMLADAGYDEDFLIDIIEHKQTRFDTTVEGLTFLANHGISERIIRFMIANENKSAGPVAVAVAAPEPAPVAVPVRVRVVKQKVLVPDRKFLQQSMPVPYMAGSPAQWTGVPGAVYQPAAPAASPYVFVNHHLFGNRWYVVNPYYAPAAPAVAPHWSWRASVPGYSQISYFPAW